MSAIVTALLAAAAVAAPIGRSDVDVERTERLAGAGSAEILWDTRGVPHIFSPDLEGAGYAFGWAHAKSHGQLLLQLYGQARGRASEYWGAQYVSLDTKIWSDRVPQTAERFYEMMDPETKMLCEAFAQGFNDHFAAFPDEIDAKWRQVLPIDGLTIFQHGYRVLFQFTFVGVYGVRSEFLEGVDASRDSFKATHETDTTHYSAYADYDYLGDLPDELRDVAGSNAWAINSNSGRSEGPAKLALNPHLPWLLYFRWYEAHIVVEDEGFDMYGSNLIGIPVLNIGFNSRLGWSHTVNVQRAYTAYEIELVGDDGYMFDGQVLPIQTEVQTFFAKRADGSLEEHTVIIESTVHGPIYARDGNRAFAARLPKVDSGDEPIDPLKQWWDMGRARNKDEFVAALRQNQLPMFTCIYADADDNIIHTSLGFVPDRTNIGGDWAFWGSAVNGSTSDTLWTDVLPFDDLFYTENPASGYLSNSNEPPWTTTLPLYVEDPASYPAFLTSPPNMSTRGQTGVRLLDSETGITLDQFMALQQSAETEEAFHSLDDLLQACSRFVGDDVTAEACDVLATWNRRTDVDSRGAVLFFNWHRDLNYVNGWSETDPLGTPNGLQDPEAEVARLGNVARALLAVNDTLDAQWGDSHKFPLGLFFDDNDPTFAVPGQGTSTAHRCMYFVVPSAKNDALISGGGDTFVSVVEFSNPPRAYSIMTTGNASNRDTEFGARHWFDNSEMLSRAEMYQVFMARQDIEDNILDFKEDLVFASKFAAGPIA